MREVLHYVQFTADELMRAMRKDVERALREQKLTLDESRRAAASSTRTGWKGIRTWNSGGRRQVSFHVRDEFDSPAVPVYPPPPLRPPMVVAPIVAPCPPGVRPFTLLLVLVFGLLGGFLLYRVWDRGTPGINPRPITPAGDLAADEKASVQLFQQTSPSVVNITTLGLTTDLYRRSVEVPQGTGTGFMWDDAGHVVTNFHVVRERQRRRR